jgi:hypothetical protein
MWTSEIPKVGGWYWWRQHDRFEPLVCRLFYDAAARTVRCDTEFAELVMAGGEWSSERIPTPDEINAYLIEAARFIVQGSKLEMQHAVAEVALHLQCGEPLATGLLKATRKKYPGLDVVD